MYAIYVSIEAIPSAALPASGSMGIISASQARSTPYFLNGCKYKQEYLDKRLYDDFYFS